MMTKKRSAEKTVRDIRRATRRHYSADEKIRIVLEGLRGEAMNRMIDIKPKIEAALEKAGYTRIQQTSRVKYHKARCNNVWFDQKVIRADRNTKGAEIVLGIAGAPNGSVTEAQAGRFDSWYTDSYPSYGSAAI
jgi:hypothetical protein